jgi:predicted methyltransferase MtxX (methanogen marker protein 4)
MKCDKSIIRRACYLVQHLSILIHETIISLFKGLNAIESNLIFRVVSQICMNANIEHFYYTSVIQFNLHANSTALGPITKWT